MTATYNVGSAEGEGRGGEGRVRGEGRTDPCGSGVTGVCLSLSRAEERPGGDCMCRRIGERMRVGGALSAGEGGRVCLNETTSQVLLSNMCYCFVIYMCIGCLILHIEESCTVWYMYISWETKCTAKKLEEQKGMNNKLEVIRRQHAVLLASKCPQTSGNFCSTYTM